MTAAPSSIDRAAVLAVARTWVGTPYHHQASLKGVGCDCLGLIRGIWREIYGSEPELPPAYSSDWSEATGRETLLEAARRHLVPISADKAICADVVLFRWRDHLPAKHAGILIGDDRVLHSQEKDGVVAFSLTPWWRRRIAAAFRFPGL
ncbi:NlpC/P60 family protein [Kaistia geumhonensis]|uniref:NlpC/P60 family putative phage cell wall peptidase n=1 Tax=Kaistia geumhonensis TaxID=410839 RepID=A0ABU0M5U7_9HYPH|nr:NlpC/P60 family protein [Kaistia geumhonensis]MCX5478445.1 NlpC/P60 family protein [Kaistia geumhonensis]MDQ0516337.1 NlpC/P60 family putative phage cell wall peptidase [Kaistia geumhonensis]